MHQSTLTRVTNILSEQMGVEADDINLLEGVVDQLGIDSIEIVMSLEEEFEVEFSDAFAEKFMYGATVMDIVKGIDSEFTVAPVRAARGPVCVKWSESTITAQIAVPPAVTTVGVLGDITVQVDKTHAMVKVDGDIKLTLDRSNGNLEDLCRLLMRASSK